jgi:DNA-binding NarL/FixJ family response regulator
MTVSNTLHLPCGSGLLRKEAIEMIIQYRPQVGLLDIHMPGESGMEVLKKIKLINRSSAVAMFSNFADSCYRSIARACGADHFFDNQKSFKKCMN